MKIKQTFFRKLFLFGMISTLALGFYSCSDDDDPSDPNNSGNGNGNNNGNEEEITANTFFISVMGETSEYIFLSEDIESGKIAFNENVKELEAAGYTWIFNTSPSAAIGLIYNQGDPGVGLGFGVASDGSLKSLGEFLITTRFTSYGFFDKYALTSVGGQTLVENGNTLLHPDGTERTDGVTFNFINLTSGLDMSLKTIETYNITGNGDQATFSGIVDMGNGEFLTGLVVSQAIDESATGGSSSGTVNYPDSVWVAAFDANLNLKRIYRDDRISYSSGRYRSQYYSQIAKAEDGRIYVFSGSYDSNTTKPCGALRINSGAEEFDQDYHFNIEAVSNGYRFRKVWPITGNYFLLEFYNDAGPISSTLAAASQYAVVDVVNKTLNWVDGIPAKDAITDTGLPAAYEGKMYFPITAGTDAPTIYIIDPATAKATKGVSVEGAESIRAVGRLVEN